MIIEIMRINELAIKTAGKKGDKRTENEIWSE